MPSKPKTPCREPGCPNTVSPPGYCKTHANKSWGPKRNLPHSNHWNSQWDKISKQVREEEPICRVCKTNPTHTADHIVAVQDGGTDDRANLQGICKPCHSKKTLAERRARGELGRVGYHP